MFTCVVTQNIVVNFYPEVIVVTPDPVSGLLTRQFTVFYEVANTSIHSVDRPLGKVELQVLDTTAIVCVWREKLGTVFIYDVRMQHRKWNQLALF